MKRALHGLGISLLAAALTAGAVLAILFFCINLYILFMGFLDPEIRGDFSPWYTAFFSLMGMILESIYLFVLYTIARHTVFNRRDVTAERA